MEQFWLGFEKQAKGESDQPYPSSITGALAGGVAGHRLGKSVGFNSRHWPEALAHLGLIYSGSRYGSRALGTLKHTNAKLRKDWDEDYYKRKLPELMKKKEKAA